MIKGGESGGRRGSVKELKKLGEVKEVKGQMIKRGESGGRSKWSKELIGIAVFNDFKDLKDFKGAKDFKEQRKQ